MTPEQAKTLKYFKWSEFRHPELCDYPFIVFLDQVRYEYGNPIVLTSDARTAAENEAASGHAEHSRHLAGQAVDMKFPPTANHLWRLVESIVRVAGERAIELEIVWGPSDRHVHLGFLEPGKASRLIIATD
jgi:hypothetical protein